VIDGSPDWVEQRDYYPFGLRMPGWYERGSPPTQEDFTGHVKDEATGLHYAGARYYSSAFGRWTTTDPILGTKGPKALLKQDARLLTRTSYNYAFSNPIGMRDPTGLAPTDWFLNNDGKIKFDEDVQSQEDLEEGQTYLGRRVRFDWARREEIELMCSTNPQREEKLERKGRQALLSRHQAKAEFSV
jgi:RHS repeat-associated protein